MRVDAHVAMLVFTCCLTMSAAGDSQRLAGVVFHGVTAYSPEATLALYRQDLGAPVDASLAERVAGRVIDRYESDGYLSPSVTTDFHADSRILLVTVREASVGHVNVIGKDHVRNAMFWEEVESLRQQRPLRGDTFRRWLADVNALDGTAVVGSMMPVRSGQSDYLVSLSVAPTRWSGLVHVDNRAAESLGYEIVQGQIGYRFANPLAGYISGSGAVALDHDRLRFGALSGVHELLEGRTSVQWSHSRSTSRLPTNEGSQNEYERARSSVGLRHSLHRVTASRLDVIANFQRYDVRQTERTGQLLRDDRVRSIDIGFGLSGIDSDGRRHDVSVRLARGLDVMGAEVYEAPGYEGSDLTYTRADLTYRVVQRFRDRWQAQLALQGQISGDRLPSSEQFLIGGRQLGGAFDPASVAGDEGIGGRFEIARDAGSVPLLGQLQTYGYYDHGFSRSNSTAGASDDASSMGIGLRLGAGKFNGSLEVAVPIEKPRTNELADAGTRVFFTLSHRLF